MIAPPSLTVSTSSDWRRVRKLEIGLSSGHCEPHRLAGQPDRDRCSAATPIAATVHAWFARSAASAPRVILIKSERDVVSVDMASLCQRVSLC